jgi:GTP cyclohydrolase II
VSCFSPDLKLFLDSLTISEREKLNLILNGSLDTPIPRRQSGKILLLGTELAKLALRQGLPVVICGGDGKAALVQAAEAIGPSDLSLLREQSGREPTLVLSARRARALGCSNQSTGAVVLCPRGELDAATLSTMVDPLAPAGPPPGLLSAFEVAPTQPYDRAALKLAKLVGLLPAALVGRLDTAPDDLPGWAAERGMPLIAAEKVLAYEHHASTTLRPVSRAQVPLAVADAQLIAFRSSTGSADHLAIIIGRPQRGQPVLTRLHSECFTGDLLGSLRCDCGDQLRGALAAMAAAGGGVLLYLAQEGRGIGLANKLRAYALQDRGLDTIDANSALGFDPDERFYWPAAEMLRQLGFTKIRLMTNNPDKLAALAQYGITIVERVPLAFPSNAHNETYLRTKAVRSGHLLDPSPGQKPLSP